jgi:hypothetical protein
MSVCLSVCMCAVVAFFWRAEPSRAESSRVERVGLNWNWNWIESMFEQVRIAAGKGQFSNSIQIRGAVGRVCPAALRCLSFSLCSASCDLCSREVCARHGTALIMGMWMVMVVVVVVVPR